MAPAFFLPRSPAEPTIYLSAKLPGRPIFLRAMEDMQEVP